MGAIESTFAADGTYLAGLGWSDIGHSTISGMVEPLDDQRSDAEPNDVLVHQAGYKAHLHLP